MKSFFTIIAVVACFSTACKKDTPEPEQQDEKPVPKEVITEITSELSGADSISTFVAAFSSIELTEAEVSEGITVFAPLNAEESAQSLTRKPEMPLTKSSGASGVTTKAGDETVIRDHVVKGVYELADLTDGTVLTSLSGLKLKVTRDGDHLWINGVALSGEPVVTSDGQTIFIVKESLTGTSQTDEPEPETTSLTIVVWDATGWDDSHPNGVPAAGADVDLYKSREDYATANPAYSGESGEDGKVTFEDIEPGTYYVYAGLDYKSNILLESDVPEEGVFTGMAIAGIYNTEEEIIGTEVLGNFRYVDGNGDGMLNFLDRLPMPFDQATITGGQAPVVDIYIGYINNIAYKPLNLEQIQQQMGLVRQGISNWHKQYQVIVDALLSDDADHLPNGFNTQWYAGLDGFSFNATTNAISNLWRGGFDHISRLNRLIWELENNTPGNPALLGEAKGLRGYLYFQLMNYFGAVPYDEGIVWQESDYDFDTDRESLFSLISADLSEALSLLPQSSTDNTKLTANAVKAIQAKVAMMKEDFATVAQLTNDLIVSGSYPLEDSEGIFPATSSEFIWNDAWAIYPPFTAFFYNRENCPYLRITEIYLMRAEALLVQGDLPGVYEILSPLSARAGYVPPQPGASTQELRAYLHALWKTEMRREGSRYVNLIRWGEAEATLGAKGYKSHHSMLPIPQYFLDAHPKVMPTAGY